MKEVYSIKDIYAIPNTGILIDYNNGRFQVSATGGQVHFYWIKSGWIFRVGAMGYTLLNLVNGGIFDGNYSFMHNQTSLLIALAIYAGSVILKKLYKPYIKLGKKYRASILER